MLRDGQDIPYVTLVYGHEDSLRDKKYCIREKKIVRSHLEVGREERAATRRESSNGTTN